MYGGREVVVPTTLENPAFAPFADREINGACVRDASGITAGLLPFPEDPQHAVPAIEAKIADIGIARLALSLIHISEPTRPY